MLNHRYLYLTGLPCSGMFFVSQLLAQHPEINSDYWRSPICDLLLNFRNFLTTNPELINPLNQDFKGTMERSLLGMRGFINGWSEPISQPWIVDFHPQWLEHLELVHLIDPDFKMVVFVRELSQIYGAIETQHQKTLLLDFPEKLASLSRAERAQKLFIPPGIIGSGLKALEQIQDLEISLQERLFYVVYEHLMTNPQEVLTELFTWLNLQPITPNLTLINFELSNYSQSFGKYVEEPYNPHQPVVNYPLPKRFETTIKQNFTWFYKTFYPGLL